MKTCTRCAEAKPATTDFFHRHGQKKDGLAPHCRACDSTTRRSRYDPPTGRRKGVVRYALAERKKRYRERHPDRVKAEQARRDRSYFVRYMTDKYRNDPAFNMVARLRNRTAKALRRHKAETTLELLGCTPDEFRAWVELHFLPGMEWSNRRDWELDHTRPFASFDLTDPAQRSQACHFTNIRPLWRRDNRVKGAKWA